MILNALQNGRHPGQQQGEGARRTHQNTPSSPHKLTVISSSGATMHTLLNKAINILAHAPNPHDYHIYIIGGYGDINERISYPLHHLRNIHNRRAHYEEFIFRENPIAAASRVTDLIEKASDQIHSLHALPIICTIPPSSLDTWKHIRLKQHKTAMLQFFPTYPQMQNNLIETILSINTNIIAINQSKHAFTPKLVDTIIKKNLGKTRGIESITRVWSMGYTPQSLWRGTGLGYWCRPSRKTDPLPWPDPCALSPWLSPSPQTLTLNLIPTLPKEETGNSEFNS